MSDQSRPFTVDELLESAPISHRKIRLVAAVTIGVALLILSMLTLSGTVLSLIVATPVMVLFSPVLVPAGFLVFLASAGFLFSGSCTVAALVAFWWMYNYVAGIYPAAEEQPDSSWTWTMRVGG